jgi:hypothetical protein
VFFDSKSIPLVVRLAIYVACISMLVGAGFWLLVIVVGVPAVR